MGGKPRKAAGGGSRSGEGDESLESLSRSLDPFSKKSAVADTLLLTHFDAAGNARMVGVGGKGETERYAVATGRILMKPETAEKIAEGQVGKGDVLGVARIAAIQALKRTSEIIPLCHPVRVTGVDVDFAIRTQAQARVSIKVRVDATDRTGVEMEAMTAVSAAALTIYDMCKAIDRGMRIDEVRLEAKAGGRSGDWWRELG